jgi:SOS-response transcriptional repressor LexA
MTHDDTNRPMWDGEALADAIGRELSRHNEDVWSFEPFLKWMAEEARARTERQRRGPRDPEELLHTGRAFRARVLARQCSLGLVEGPAPLIVPPRLATPTQVLDEARAAGAVPCVDLAAAAGAGRELWDEPAERWLTLPPGAPPRLRAIALRIAGESMAPLLRTGDTILVELGPSLTRGRVVVARHPDDGYVCKRVEKLGRREIHLASIDPAYGSVIIPRDERLIVGTVRLVWRG